MQQLRACTPLCRIACHGQMEPRLEILQLLAVRDLENRAQIGPFGHEEADVLRQIKALISRLPRPA